MTHQLCKLAVVTECSNRVDFHADYGGVTCPWSTPPPNCEMGNEDVETIYMDWGHIVDSLGSGLGAKHFCLATDGAKAKGRVGSKISRAA